MEDRFQIKDLSGANWALRKIKEIKDEVQKIDDLYQEELLRINSWKEREIEEYNTAIEYFENLLEQYMREEREKDPKFKISTPYGKVSTRKQQPKFIRKDDEFIKWLKENNKTDYIKVEEKANWGDFKKNITVKDGIVVTEDGEIVDGIVAEEREDKITIKVD